MPLKPVSEPPMTQTNAAATCPETPTVSADLPCATCDAGNAPKKLVARNPDLNCRDFRRTLGSFATGITVITALGREGQPLGMTISSFNSVSLDPPLILWSLSLSSPSLEAFRNASHYAVNVLSAEQEQLSNRFASRNGNRFADVDVRPGLAGVPLIEGCCAWFECTQHAHYAGGDHLIFVGYVEQFEQNDAASPLIFHGGSYRRLKKTETHQVHRTD